MEEENAANSDSGADPSLDGSAQTSVPSIEKSPRPSAEGARKRRWFAHALGFVRSTLVVVGALFALGALSIWFVAGHLNDYREDIELAVGAMLGHTITIGKVEASWEGLTPVLRLRNVDVFRRTAGAAGHATNAPVVRLATAEIALDPIASARTRALRSTRLRIIGATLTLTRTNGRVAVAGFGNDHPDDAGVVDSSGSTWGNLIASQQNLELLATNLLWSAASVAGKPRFIGQLNARIWNNPKGHRVEGRLTLAGPSPAPVTFKADIDGNLRDGAWASYVAIESSQLELARVSHLINAWRLGSDATRPVTLAGEASGNLTVALTPAGIQRIDGSLSIVGLKAYVRRSSLDGGAAAGEFSIERVDASGELRPTSDGWIGEFRDLRIASRAGAWPTRTVSVQIEESDDQRLTVEVTLDTLRLEHVRSLIEPHISQASLKEALRESAAQGALTGVSLQAVLRRRSLLSANVEAEVQGLSLRASGDLPGISGLNGRLFANLSGGRFEITPGPAAAELPTLYSQPRDLTSVDGSMHWSVSARGGSAWTAGLDVRANELHATLSGSVQWGTDQPAPFLDGRLVVSKSRYTQLAPWVLIRKLPAALRRWLGRAIKDGDIHALTLAASGYVSDLPFHSGKDGFRLSAEFANVDFTYAAGWPTARSLRGILRIEGSRLEARLSGGSIFDAKTKSFAASIADLRKRPVALAMSGSIAGNITELIRFVSESPLHKTIGPTLAELAARGPARLQLELGLELPAVTTTTVTGQIQIIDALLESSIGMALEHASGTFAFNRNGLKTSQVQATYLETPVTFSSTSAGAGMVYKLSGDADQGLLSRVATAIGLEGFKTAAVSGASRFTVTLAVPATDDPRPRVLTISSSLTGMDLDLPGSLGKRSGDERPLELRLAFDEATQRSLHISYGPRWNAAFLLKRGPAAWKIDRGHIRVGGGKATVPDRAGVIVDGALAAFNFDSWSRALSGPDALGTPHPESWLGNIRSVQVEVGSIHAFGQRLSADRLTLNRPANGWEVILSGDDIDGRVFVPHEPSPDSNPITVRLNRLHLAAPKAGEPYEGRPPRELPPLHVALGSVKVDELRLGKVGFRTVPTPTGLQIVDIQIEAPAFEVNGNGAWALDASGHTTELNVKLHSERLGDLFASLGYAEASVEGGDTDVIMDVTWPGVPSEFDLKIVSGFLHARSTKGQLLDVKPGITGRAFGLLSLAAIPRHLRMDFSHVFGEGFSYDTIEGSFHFESGNAYTNNLNMIGPSARVDLAGRTGLVNRDYDQLITVTPRLTSSLPLAPLWLAEKMLKTDLFNRVFSSRYALTGGWEDPKITRLLEPDQDISN